MTREELLALKIKPINKKIEKEVKAIWDGIAKPLDGLGEFELLLARIGGILESTDLNLQKKAIIAMCADNGIVAEHVSQSGQEVTAIVTSFMGKQQSSVGKMAAHAGVDVIPVDIGINSADKIPGVRDCKIMQGTRDFLEEPAMTEEEALRAIEVGIQLVQECKDKGYTLLGTGEMGIGNTTTSSAVAIALMEKDVTDPVVLERWIGRGAGLSDAGLQRKEQVIKSALEKYPVAHMDALQILATFGGLDIAGMAGVCIGGALYHIPVILDGLISTLAGLVAQRLVPGVQEFLIPSHCSKEPAARVLADELQLHPVIDANLALGEGTGAVMMCELLDLALTLYEKQTTFDTMEIEQYERFSDKDGVR